MTVLRLAVIGHSKRIFVDTSSAPPQKKMSDTSSAHEEYEKVKFHILILPHFSFPVRLVPGSLPREVHFYISICLVYQRYLYFFWGYSHSYCISLFFGFTVALKLFPIAVVIMAALLRHQGIHCNTDKVIPKPSD